MPAGPMTTCCRCSAVPKTSNAARIHIYGVGGETHRFRSSPVRSRPRTPSSIGRAPLRPARGATFQRRGKQDGAGLYQVTQRRGRRCSAAVAFLQPALDAHEPDGADRPSRGRASRFEGSRATGVWAARTKTARADRRTRARSYCRPAFSVRRSCYCSRASDAREELATSRHRPRSTNCRASAPTSSITWTWRSSIVRRIRG